MNPIYFNKAKFLISAAQSGQFPEDVGAEVAFIGRSNVGKSSAINALTHRKKLAKTSKTPGRTQLVNFFELDETKRLVDLPGYGYAKVAGDTKERWQKLVDIYLRSRKSLKVLVLLMDIRHPLMEFDQMILQWAFQSAIPVHVLLTKSDKLSRGRALGVLQKVRAALKNFEGQIHVQLFSASKLTGCEELEKILSQHLMNKQNLH